MSFPRGSTATEDALKKGGKRVLHEESVFGQKKAKRSEVVVAPPKFVKGKTDAVSGLKSMGHGLTGPSPKSHLQNLESLSFNKLNTGCLVLGLVLQINQTGLLISLPGGLTGVVPYNEVSDVLHRKVAESISKEHIKEHGKTVLPPLDTVVRALQVVRCYIIGHLSKGVDSKKKTISLSMRSSLVNKGLAMKHFSIGFPISGCVASKEDHGYIISTGVSGVNAFLPEKNISKEFKDSMVVGQPVECVTQNINEGSRTLTLRTQAKAVHEAVTHGSLLAFNSLCPGMKLNVIVDEKTDTCLVVTFLGLFFGVIDNSSLNGPEQKNALSVGDVLQARIILLDPAAKVVRFSIKNHILELRASNYLPTLGSVMDDLVVSEVLKKLGVILKPPAGAAAPLVEVNKDSEKPNKKGSSSAPTEDPKHFFIYRKQLSDAPTEPSSRVIDQDRITKVYSQGAVVRHVRVKGFNLVEGWVLASNIADYIDEKVVHSNDVSVGQVLEVVVTGIRDFGLVLKLGSSDTSAGLSAICPTFHSSDVVVEGNLKKKFKVGQHLNMRVWEVSGNAIIMTNKKTIVDMSMSNVIQSYEEAAVGKTSTGVISKINSLEGITVHFFNKVKGLIAVPVLIKQGVLSANDEYRVGQVVQVVIIRKVSVLADKKHAHSAQQILYLGLNMNVSPEAVVALMADLMISGHGPEKASKPVAVLKDGESAMEVVEGSEDIASNSVEFVSGVISKISVEENSVQIALDDGRKGRMDKHHFFDFAFAAEQIFSTPNSEYKVGFRVEKALVMSENKGILTLTAKPLLIHAAEALLASTAADSAQKSSISDDLSLPGKVADLSPGQIVAGFVLKVETYGVLVRFRDNLNALAPRPNLSDKFISTPVGRFQVGDSMRCVVQRVDLAKERALVTLKSSMVTPYSGYLPSFFRESFAVNRATSSAYVSLIKFLSANPVASTINVTVSSIEEYGIVFLCADDSTLIVVRNSNLATSNLKVGKAAKVVILDIDTENFVLEGSTHVEKFTPSSAKAVLGAKVDATILAVKERYLVVVTAAGALGYVAVSDYHNPKPDMSEYLVDTTISVSLLVAPAKKAAKTQSVDTYPQTGLSVFTLYQDLNSSDRRAIVAKVIRAAEDSDSRLHREISGVDGDADQASTPSTLVLRQKFIEGLRVGYLTKWVIHSVSSHEVMVLPEHSDSLMMNIKAKIHISNAINPYESSDKATDVLRDAAEVNDVLTHESHPFHKLKVGNKIWCYVLQIRKSNKSVESVAAEDETHSAKDEYIVYLSTTFRKPNADGEVSEKREKGEKADFLPFFKMVQSHGKDAIKSPLAVAVVVTKITEANCVVSISPYLSAVLHFMDVSYDPEVVALFKRKVFIGLKLVVAVTHITDNNGSLQIKVSRAVIENKLIHSKNTASLPTIKDITALLQDGSIALSRDYKVGEVVSGILNLTNHKVPKPPGVLITLRGASFGRVCVTEIRDLGHWNDLSGFYKGGHNNLNGMKHGEIVKARVLSINKANNCVELSLRPSRVNAKTAKEAVAVDATPEEGELVKGYVANISKKGCFLRLSSGLTGQVMMKDLSDEFVSEPEKVFPVGKLVEGRLLSVNHVTQFAQLTLKASLLHSELSSGGLEPHNFAIGDTVTGVVKTVTEFGVFVALDNSSLVGLSRRAAANLDPTKGLEEEYEVGDIVKAKILTLSALKVGLGLKEHYFRNDGDEEDGMDVEQILRDEAAEFMPSFEGDSEESEAEEVVVVKKASKKEKAAKKVVEPVEVKSSSSSSNKRKAVAPVPVESDDEDEEAPQLSIFDHSFPQQDSAQGLLWDDFAQSKAVESAASESDSNGEEEDEQHAKKNLRTRQKEALNRKAERDVYTKEARLVDGTLVPQSPDDFERALIATPNSSFLWIQYMAHYLESSDVIAARGIATRALKTINFREEDEKFNVWVTLLNVEHKYGTMDTLEAAFTRAISESKTKKIFLALAETYENAGDNSGAQGIYDKALKRPALKKSKKVWAAYLAFKLRSGDVKGAKEQFARSMQSLSRHKHVEVIAKYALSEFDYGSADRGRVVFEDLLSNYPKRTDIWHLYLDKEIKLNNFVEARNLFERIITSKASARNLKSAFKKYLNFELTHGDEESQESVRQKARDYVNNIV